MAKWIPGVAIFGLICLMVLPAPGIWGVLIGGVCVVAIVISTILWALDAMSTRLLVRYARWRQPRAVSSRRAIHAGSGKAKKVVIQKVVATKAATGKLATKRV